jgi:hypothetical protein
VDHEAKKSKNQKTLFRNLPLLVERLVASGDLSEFVMEEACHSNTNGGLS